jgi:hypothetical protein
MACSGTALLTYNRSTSNDLLNPADTNPQNIQYDPISLQNKKAQAVTLLSRIRRVVVWTLGRDIMTAFRVFSQTLQADVGAVRSNRSLDRFLPNPFKFTERHHLVVSFDTE